MALLGLLKEFLNLVSGHYFSSGLGFSCFIAGKKCFLLASAA
jgi:hypothetical protein